jgi:hypothetical protein
MSALPPIATFDLVPYSSFTVDGVDKNGALPSAWNGVASAPSSSLTILEFE